MSFLHLSLCVYFYHVVDTAVAEAVRIEAGLKTASDFARLISPHKPHSRTSRFFTGIGAGAGGFSAAY